MFSPCKRGTLVYSQTSSGTSGSGTCMQLLFYTHSALCADGSPYAQIPPTPSSSACAAEVPVEVNSRLYPHDIREFATAGRVFHWRVRFSLWSRAGPCRPKSQLRDPRCKDLRIRFWEEPRRIEGRTKDAASDRRGLSRFGSRSVLHGSVAGTE